MRESGNLGGQTSLFDHWRRQMENYYVTRQEVELLDDTAAFAVQISNKRLW